MKITDNQEEKEYIKPHCMVIELVEEGIIAESDDDRSLEDVPTNTDDEGKEKDYGNEFH